MKKLLSQFDFSMNRAAASLVSGWLFAVSAVTLLFPNAALKVSFTNEFSPILFCVLVCGFTLPILLFDAHRSESSVAKYCVVISLICLSLSLAIKRNDVYTYIVTAIVTLLALYCLEKEVSPSFLHEQADKTTAVAAIASAAVIATVTVGSISVFRYLTFSAPNYDFGIFCNMFHNMSKDLSAVTTCERDKLLSHFAIHISPIFYILLPFYYIFPSPLTLAVLQPLIIFSGIIPVYLLAKHLKLSQNASIFISVAYAFFAPLSSGCFYDLHENCFLVPLLLWLFYFFEKGKKIPMFIFMLLVLLVKEDAFIYIAVFALYLIISRKKCGIGFTMLFAGAVYFFAACAILTMYGNGVMSSRYANLENGGGLIDAAKTLFMNFGFAASETLVTKTEGAEKFVYLFELILPLAFIPLCSKKFSRYILILPIFINLFTRYTYQYDISYQYTFGIIAFLFYLCLLNLADTDKKQQENSSFAAIILSVLLFVTIVVPKSGSYVGKYIESREVYNSINEALEIIPDDAEVTASTFILPHLAQRSVIYEDEYHDTPSTEYFVLDARYNGAKGRDKKYIDAGYELIYEKEKVIKIYQKAQ